MKQIYIKAALINLQALTKGRTVSKKKKQKTPERPVIQQHCQKRKANDSGSWSSMLTSLAAAL